MADLKHCPFCRDEARLSDSVADERFGYEVTYTIKCQGCGAMVVGHAKKDKQGWTDDPKLEGRAETIARWNRRDGVEG